MVWIERNAQQPSLTSLDVHATRRLYLLLDLCLLADLAGFMWGQRSGYSQGRTDTLKVIEQRMNEPPKADRPVQPT